MTLALDRIRDIGEMVKSGFVAYKGVDFERYFEDTIGFTKTNRDRAQRVILALDASNAPYVETKPIHPSQQMLKKREDRSILIRIDVVLNYELEREILGFGENIKVIAPPRLLHYIKRRLEKSLRNYANNKA